MPQPCCAPQPLHRFACGPAAGLRVSLCTGDKKAHLPLLLVGDEQESMIDAYLTAADLFLLHRGDAVLALAAVTVAGDTCELCNLAVQPTLQHHGLGSALLGYLCAHYAPRCRQMVLGTGDSPLTLPFYQKMGFAVLRREKDYFLQHYDHPIYEAGVQLRDRLVLARPLAHCP